MTHAKDSEIVNSNCSLQQKSKKKLEYLFILLQYTGYHGTLSKLMTKMY